MLARRKVLLGWAPFLIIISVKIVFILSIYYVIRRAWVTVSKHCSFFGPLFEEIIWRLTNLIETKSNVLCDETKPYQNSSGPRAEPIICEHFLWKIYNQKIIKCESPPFDFTAIVSMWSSLGEFARSNWCEWPRSFGSATWQCSKTSSKTNWVSAARTALRGKRADHSHP